MRAVADNEEPAVVTYPIVIKLRVPVEWGTGETVRELTFRRGRLGDTKGIKEGSIDNLILVASRMCGQPVGVIESLDQDDSGEVMSLTRAFLEKSLGTGSVPSPS